ncbi:MAG: hypothetical protein BMS9Abin09_0164 [Gammaproteobacteria bacterium]|nr:MAG: hypothetical protein BMS9Abin09_0164 [Gammaproteobacteria bacterium]
MKNKADTDKAILMAAFAKIDVVALAIALGSLFALVLFLATAGLLLKGAPPGVEVGPHLGLFGIYLPGYSVSWFGAVVGAFYAGIIGGFLGFVLAVLWNLTHYLYVVAIVVRTAWWRMMAE